jgi:hypothetical protein
VYYEVLFYCKLFKLNKKNLPDELAILVWFIIATCFYMVCHFILPMPNGGKQWQKTTIKCH